MTVHILSMRDRAPEGVTVIDTTTRSSTWSRELSPMILTLSGCKVENIWQYTKVYSQHWDGSKPTPEWYEWSNAGFRKKWADRYPMGKGARPVCSWFRGFQRSYIEARKEIYVPAYRDAVVGTEAFKTLWHEHNEDDVWLRDFDGYDHRALGMSWDDVLNCETRKMGHAFVLGMLLEGII